MPDTAEPNSALAEQFGIDRVLAALDTDEVQMVLINHGRTDITRCHCGWADLGRSHAQHVQREIATVIRSILGRAQP